MIERYEYPEMKKVWSDETRYKKFAEVEMAHIDGLAKTRVISHADAEAIKEHCTVDVDLIHKYEQDTHHELFAFLRCLENFSTKEGKRWIHYGLTSSDVLDTANSLIVKEASRLIYKEIDEMLETLKYLAYKYEYTPCVGRTHGQVADMTSFGLKFALWYDELFRNKYKLKDAEDEFCVGKLRGAVGTYSSTTPESEEYAIKKVLKLRLPAITTQVVGRDRYADFMSRLCLVSGTMEMIATEIRNLSRTEISEVSEPFGKKQRGSSAMPHKHNPIKCENVCGCARIMRGYMMASFENTSLWDERDISHSSAERFELEDGMSLLYHMLKTMNYVLSNLKVNESQIEHTFYEYMPSMRKQQVFLKLIERGVERDRAYNMVKKAYVDYDSDDDDSQIRKYIPANELDEIFIGKDAFDEIVCGVEHIYEEVFEE